MRWQLMIKIRIRSSTKPTFNLPIRRKIKNNNVLIQRISSNQIIFVLVRKKKLRIFHDKYFSLFLAIYWSIYLIILRFQGNYVSKCFYHFSFTINDRWLIEQIKTLIFLDISGWKHLPVYRINLLHFNQ